AGTDEDVVLALQVAVRDARRMHRVERLEEPGEKPLPVREATLVLTQRRPFDVLEHEVIADEPERSGYARHAAQPLIHGGLPPQRAEAEAMAQRRLVRLLDDDGTDRRVEQVGARLVALAEETPGPACELPL